MDHKSQRLPDGPLVGWLGDDFTGAAAVMEVLTFAGLPSALFLAPPTVAQLAAFPGLRGIGIASTARTMSPAQMDAALPGPLARLRALGPQVIHYKVCSTLDSSPDVGSIGRAIEIGAEVCEARLVPVLVAAPQMRRYQVFGHLFAGMGEAVHRLDRHPVMSRHPVTPMDEADVARHIARQSDRLAVRCVTLEHLGDGLGAAPDAGGLAAVTLDCIDAASEAQVGRMLWEARAECPFVVGSQGVEYALVRHWQETGLIPQVSAPGSIGQAKGVVVVSGSVSPVTAEQIAWSMGHGFAGVRFDAASVCDAAALGRAVEAAVAAGLAALGQGADPLIHTAAGPDDPAVVDFRAAVAASGIGMEAANARVGEALGLILQRILQASGVRRAVVSGGDTSGFATRQLGVHALTALAPTIPGAAIFRAHADGPMDGLELALKGGQMGSPDYFGWVREGGGVRE